MSNWWEADPIASSAPPPSVAAAGAPQAASGDNWWSNDPVAPTTSPGMMEGAVRAAATGVPIIGGALNKLDAATNATLAPVLNRFFSPDQQLQEPTWGGRYQHSLGDQNQLDQSFQQQHPIVDTAAQIAGGAASMVPAASTAIGARLLGMTGSTLPRMMATGAVTGGVIGGLDAATRGQDPTIGAMTGGAFGGAGPLVGRAAGAIANRFVPSAVPTAEQLSDAAESGYTSLRNMGVQLNPDAVSTLAATTEQSLYADGLRPVLAPKTFGVLSELQNPPAGATMNYGDVHALRRVLGTVAGSPDATEALAATRTIRALDGFLASPPPGAVAAGDAQAAARTLAEANANYAAMKRSNTLQGKVDAADLQAASANSGVNFENALRQRLRGLLNSPAQRRGFSPDEIVAMQSIVRGTAPANVIRTIGNLLGGGGGLGSVASGAAGFAAGGPFGAVAAPAAGYALKRLGNTMAANKANALDELVRSRSPLGVSMPQPNRAAIDRQALMRAILAARSLQQPVSGALQPNTLSGISGP
jgi:hypothetical protein